ncbi:hypothetical protein GCM10020001_059550 [Nonomuraea salmonea]
MRKVPLLATLTLAASLLAAPAQAAPSHPFQNPALPLDQRVSDLLGRLTLDEKLSLLHQSQPAIPRLGIGYHKNGTEALHGVAWSNHLDDNWNQKFASGTVFPQAVGLASTWDPELVKRVGSAVGDEARGYNATDPVLWGGCRCGRPWSTCCATPGPAATRRATPRTRCSPGPCPPRTARASRATTPSTSRPRPS